MSTAELRKTSGLCFIYSQKFKLNQGRSFRKVPSPGTASSSPPHLPKAAENLLCIIEASTFKTIFLMIYVLYFALALLEGIADFSGHCAQMMFNFVYRLYSFPDTIPEMSIL